MDVVNDDVVVAEAVPEDVVDWATSLVADLVEMATAAVVVVVDYVACVVVAVDAFVAVAAVVVEGIDHDGVVAVDNYYSVAYCVVDVVVVHSFVVGNAEEEAHQMDAYYLDCYYCCCYYSCGDAVVKEGPAVVDFHFHDVDHHHHHRPYYFETWEEEGHYCEAVPEEVEVAPFVFAFQVKNYCCSCCCSCCYLYCLDDAVETVADWDDEADDDEHYY